MVQQYLPLTTVYSYSALECFRQCPQKFKLQYIDKVETDGQTSIESFNGTLVHTTLQRLYEDRRHEKIDSLDEITYFLRSSWNDLFDDSVIITKGEYTVENYLKMAERYLADYYKRYYPFDQGRTIALEERITVDLDGSGNYRLQGYIDRLTDLGNGTYEIHDYKTSSRLPKRSDLEEDLQLAIYSMGVRENYPDVRDVDLIWHYLAFDKEFRLKKEKDQMERVRSSVVGLIDAIEGEKKFESKGSALCDWCEYNDFCERFVHQRKVERLSKNEFLNDPGVKLVDRFQDLSEQRQKIVSELDEQLEKVKAALIELCRREGMSVIYGSKMKVSVFRAEDIKVPAWNDENRKLLNAILREYGIWDEVSTLDKYELKRRLKEGGIPADLIESIRDLVTLEPTYRLSLKKKD